MFRLVSRRALALVLPALLLSACSAVDPTDGDGPDVPPSTRAHTVSGRVTDERGRPLAGVEVFADNTAAYDSNVLAVTDAQGRYSIDLAGIVPNSWRVGAYVETNYLGSHYTMRLVADDDRAFSAAPGVTRNLTWQLSGENPDGGYYGAFSFVYIDYNRTDFDVDYEDVVLTFTPNGPIIDGSAGATVERRLEGDHAYDVPVGRYTVTARYQPEGQAPRPMLIASDHDATYAASTTNVFVDDPLYGPHMELTVAGE